MFLTTWLWFSPPDRVEFWWGFPVVIYFAIVVVMDIEYRVVLHPVSLAGVILGSIVGIYQHGLEKTLLGGVTGFLTMYVLFKFGEVFMRWVNRRRGEEIDEVALGFGDVNMAGVVGLFLGLPVIILGLLFAIFAGGGFSIIFIIVSLFLRRFRAFAALPYAPFLALAVLVMLFFPNEVAMWINPLSTP
jgi:leader peptidase (prepilin peptidase)/N-methyltransferase